MTAAVYSEMMRGIKFRSVVGVLCVAMLGSGLLSGCIPDPEIRAVWRGSENSKDQCPPQVIIAAGVWEADENHAGTTGDLGLRLYVNDRERTREVEHSSEFIKERRLSGRFELIVGDTLPKHLLHSGFNRLDAVIYEKEESIIYDRPPLKEKVLSGEIFVGDCDEEQLAPSSAAPEPDNQQPVSDLKAEFHFSNTFGCPFMQVVDVAGVADNPDVSLKFSIDGTSVEHTAEFITEGEYVEEGFDGYFDLVAGDDFDATLEGEHTLKVEVSDGVGSVTIEGKFTADSC